MTSQPARKVLLVGWDAADWNVARPLLEQGKMPALRRLMDTGVWGDLATIRPVLSPMLWTSIATGKRAWKHGIHGFAEPCPATGGIRPITNLSRQTKAIWNIFSQQGRRSNVVGWWPSHPAEPIRGVMVSNHFQQAVSDRGARWPMRPGTVHPKNLAAPLAEMRIHPAELQNEHILPFIPRAAEIDQTKDKRMATCAKILAEISSIHAAATACMQLEPWEFMAVYYDGIDHFGHGFMKYHPPRQSWIDARDFELYGGVIEAAYRYHDMMLDTLLRIAGDDVTVMLISDHGFEPGDLRPRDVPNEPAGPAAEHSQFGIFVLRGPGIKTGERIHGGTLLDIAPTLLHLCGLPVGRDMDGKVLVNCFAEEIQPEFIDSWDAVPGEDGRHPAHTRLDGVEERESLRQLVDLGYIEEPNPDRAKAVDETVRELEFNLAQAYADGGCFGEAANIFERLWERWPEENRFGVRLLNCAIALQETEWARATFDLLLARKQEHAVLAADELRQLTEKLPQEAEQAGTKLGIGEFDQKTPAKLRRLRGRAATNAQALAFLNASVLMLEQRPEDALDALIKAEASEMALRPSVLARRGEALRVLRRWSEAEAVARELIKIDPRNPEGHYALACCDLAQRRVYEAAVNARQALEFNFHHPWARYTYAKALVRIGQPKFAAQVLRTAVAEMPGFALAHAQLARISRQWLRDEAAAARHAALAREAAKRNRERRRTVSPGASPVALGADAFPRLESITGRLPANGEPPLIVVSGLPRSGTSLMMQMLAAGGLKVVSDAARVADESNPRGYFEDERVKRLAIEQDRSWLKKERGSVVKIVAPLLAKIPGDLPCRIVFMERSACDVVASQRKMLARNGKVGARIDDAALARTFAAQLRAALALCQLRKNIELLPVNYAETVANPAGVAERVANFIGGELNRGAMARAVEPTLSRTGRI